MTLATLLLRSLTFHWRTSVAVALGVAAATSVLAGALVVGESVRGSLREIALGRLGRTDAVLASAGFFREALADDVRAGARAAAPIIVANGVVTHERSRRRAAEVTIYGVDERFWSFHGLTQADGVYLSPALASDLSVQPGDVLLTRVQKPSQIPIESLFGRKEDIGRTMRLQATAALARERLGEFALQPQQAEVRALFAPLSRIQRELAVQRQVNTVLLAEAPAPAAAVEQAVGLEDLGIRVTPLTDPAGGSTLAIESDTGIVNAALESATGRVATALGLRPLPVFTYLANAIRNGERSVPYSLVTATDLAAVTPAAAASPRGAAPADAIVLNTWAARELAASAGDRIEVDYYLWDAVRGLETETAGFTVSAITPIEGLAADRRLVPLYPGITAADSLADWDPPFPIDLSKVRPADEAYWRDFRTTPKGFIAYERGRDLWRSRYGTLTSLRLVVPASEDASAVAQRVRQALRSELPAEAMGVSVTPVRALALASSAGATDFAEYFTYFSFFLVVSALMLVVLFFKLGIEQRLRQVGVMRASGYPMRTVRRLLLGEAVILALAGGAAGAAGAVVYARVIIHGLSTWWVGAVGTTLLRVHASPTPIAIGAAGGIIAAVLCVLVALRAVGRLTPKALLQAQSLDAGAGLARREGRWRKGVALMFALAGAAMLAVGFASRSAQTAAFFGAGGSWLIALLLAFSASLRARDRQSMIGRGGLALARLGFRSASARPARSVLSASLIASATFVIFSVDAFRRSGDAIVQDRHSSTGGYALLARSEIPILHDLNTPAGREALLVDGPELARTQVTRFRLRPGQDASCLNLYQPTNPTIIAPEPGFIESNRFVFADTLDPTEAERANPWQLLRRTFDDGAVAAIADATSLQYVLHQAVGDTFSIDTGGDAPLRLRFVAALEDSVLQGELIIAEEAFTRLFPGRQGYQFLLIEDPSVRTAADVTALGEVVERELEDFGVDAVGTAERLAAFHRVENTYLSTFQALGGLGLLLGTVGLATVMFRNVLERRRELALLRAVGYDRRAISTVIIAEVLLLLATGLGVGTLCAALAVAPAWLNRGGAMPGAGLFILLGAVLGAGLLSSLAATRLALSGSPLEALRAE